LAALALSGCKSSQEKSAQLEREAKRHTHQSQEAFTITKLSMYVKVLGAQILQDSGGTAAVLTLRNSGPKPLSDVPVAITVHGGHGNVLFQNNAPGLEPALTSVALLEPGAQTIWIDDQVQASETPSSVSAVIGEGSAVSSPVPRLSVSGVASVEGAGGVPAAAGTVHNESTVAQRSLVVYGVARRGEHIVGAGRGILPELAPHQSSRVEIYFSGQTQGAKLEMSAPPTTF
jgi:hypothetical protein